MRIFSELMRKAINEYKQILRRSLSEKDRAEKIESMGLSRKELNMANDALLYQKASNIIKDIHAKLATCENSPAWYSGLDEYCQYLEDELKQYYLDRNKVIHIAQQASRALVSAIQLMSLPNVRLSPEITQKLKTANATVIRFGSEEQIEQLKRAYQLHKTRNLNFFLPLSKHVDMEASSARH